MQASQAARFGAKDEALIGYSLRDRLPLGEGEQACSSRCPVFDRRKPLRLLLSTDTVRIRLLGSSISLFAFGIGHRSLLTAARHGMQPKSLSEVNEI